MPYQTEYTEYQISMVHSWRVVVGPWWVVVVVVVVNAGYRAGTAGCVTYTGTPDF